VDACAHRCVSALRILLATNNNNNNSRFKQHAPPHGSCSISGQQDGLGHDKLQVELGQLKWGS
jgi:hypothetical protein